MTYLRTLDDGTPAAGKFEGWPNELSEFKLLDPCCGSGHFLVAAFLLLVPMRMAAEGLSAMDAVDAVLADNLHGLELDARCVEIAVFALALAAWRFPDENGDPLGVRAGMPAPQVACCGLKVAAKPEDWMALVPDDVANTAYLRQELRLLHASFAQAPLLGSLLDPARSLKNDLATSSFDTLRELLGRALATERPATLWGQASELQDDSWDLALTAKGLLDAARLLDGRYHLVATNVPYLARGKQHDVLKDYCDSVPVTPQLPCLDGICIGSPATSLNAPFEPVLSVAKQLIRNIPSSKKFADIEARAAHLDAVYRKGDMDQFEKDGAAIRHRWHFQGRQHRETVCIPIK